MCFLREIQEKRGWGRSVGPKTPVVELYLFLKFVLEILITFIFIGNYSYLQRYIEI
jgi:hypothetical protein